MKIKELQNVSINSENAILVIVDMENEFCSPAAQFLKPGGMLYSETKIQTLPGIISATRGLIEQARAAGIPIIYIQSVRTLQEPEFTVFGHPKPFLEIGTWAAEIVDELKPHEGDIVVQKFCHDPFFRPDLDRVLQRLVSDPTKYYAIVTGGGVNVCLYHAVMGFYLRNYWTIVPTDCVVYSVDSDTLDSDLQIALRQFSHHAYPNVFLSRSDLIEISAVPAAARPTLVPQR